MSLVYINDGKFQEIPHGSVLYIGPGCGKSVLAEKIEDAGILVYNTSHIAEVQKLNVATSEGRMQILQDVYSDCSDSPRYSIIVSSFPEALAFVHVDETITLPVFIAELNRGLIHADSLQDHVMWIQTAIRAAARNKVAVNDINILGVDDDLLDYFAIWPSKNEPVWEIHSKCIELMETHGAYDVHSRSTHTACSMKDEIEWSDCASCAKSARLFGLYIDAGFEPAFSE